MESEAAAARGGLLQKLPFGATVAWPTERDPDMPAPHARATPPGRRPTGQSRGSPAGPASSPAHVLFRPGEGAQDAVLGGRIGSHSTAQMGDRVRAQRLPLWAGAQRSFRKERHQQVVST